MGENNGLLWVWMEPGSDAALKAATCALTATATHTLMQLCSTLCARSVQSKARSQALHAAFARYQDANMYEAVHHGGDA